MNDQTKLKKVNAAIVTTTMTLKIRPFQSI